MLRPGRKGYAHSRVAAAHGVPLAMFPGGTLTLLGREHRFMRWYGLAQVRTAGPTPGTPYAYDGEVSYKQPELTIDKLPEALTVHCPAPA